MEYSIVTEKLKIGYDENIIVPSLDIAGFFRLTAFGSHEDTKEAAERLEKLLLQWKERG